ncbi:hypothetical protein [Adhaeribacter pallidiroseus]|uniref:Uncharacterized protein n=1 Tax=Adhaeribacter pallidiroseus TaxID=2072847 RepID=A0A369QFN4_9BACT|nr:hypothetical protein [Adhaeribacter pallidiroseus]RDC62365.1 hypothetical protein AHMF7616_00958 [Adhaeribacter pallidiroseus]
MKELKQKHLFTKKEFLLTPKSIRVICKSIKEDLEYTIKYDQLGFDIVKRHDKTAILPAIFLSFFFLLDLYLLVDALIHRERTAIVVMWLLSAVFFGVITGLAFYQTNKNRVYLTGGAKVLSLLRAKPSEAEVDLFIEATLKAIRTYHRNKFAGINSYQP